MSQMQSLAGRPAVRGCRETWSSTHQMVAQSRLCAGDERFHPAKSRGQRRYLLGSRQVDNARRSFDQNA